MGNECHPTLPARCGFLGRMRLAFRVLLYVAIPCLTSAAAPNLATQMGQAMKLVQSGKLRAALTSLEPLVGHPDMPAKRKDMILGLSAMLHGRLGLHAEALKLYVKLHPTKIAADPSMIMGQAMSLHETGAVEDALKLHRQAATMKANPQHRVQALQLAARDLNVLGRHDET